jgi:hypothetical protein
LEVYLALSEIHSLSPFMRIPINPADLAACRMLDR